MHCFSYIGGIMWQRFFVTIILFASLPVNATTVYDRIAQGLTPNSMTLIGESHQRPESIVFFESLITHYLQQNKCLTVALEISSGQQSLIDEIQQGQATVANLKIASPIDHPSLRKLIQDLAEMRINGKCLKLVAVDADFKPGVERDQWIAKELIKLSGEAPVLALLGSLHTLKKVDWMYAELKKEIYAAGILVSSGYDVKSYPQVWTERDCNTRTRLIPADKPEATKLLNNRLIASLNAFEIKKATDAIDGTILWVWG